MDNLLSKILSFAFYACDGIVRESKTINSKIYHYTLLLNYLPIEQTYLRDGNVSYFALGTGPR